MTEHLKALVPKLANHRIMVIGDVILDEYLIGRAQRLSREAPIPILEFESRQYIPGGAANPAVNIVALNSEAVVIGIVGTDDAATQLNEQLDERGIDVTGLVIDSSKPTTLKTRILAQMGLRYPQQIARIDTLSRQPISNTIEAGLMHRIQNHVSRSQAVLISDYQNGLLNSHTVSLIKQVVNLPIIVDTQGALDKYHGVDVIKCNAEDAISFLNTRLTNNVDFAEAASELANRLMVKLAVVITRGADGVTIATQDDTAHIGAPKISDVYDTVGAGDTWIAVLTLAMVGGATLADAAMLANYASGIVVRHVGNYTPSADELLHALST
ncbi:MAG: bifunctional heptose 7-phosphate kinase/heptose 1-phosphate adenyltransferase [Anaerolineae bacterium]